MFKEKEKGKINLQTLHRERRIKQSGGEGRREAREDWDHISVKAFSNFPCKCYGDILIFGGMI